MQVQATSRRFSRDDSACCTVRSAWHGNSVAFMAVRTRLSSLSFGRTPGFAHFPRALSEPHSPAMPNATTPAPQPSGDERETLLVGLRRMGLANDDRFV